MLENAYVHGYHVHEVERLRDQAAAPTHLIHERLRVSLNCNVAPAETR